MLFYPPLQIDHLFPLTFSFFRWVVEKSKIRHFELGSRCNPLPKRWLVGGRMVGKGTELNQVVTVARPSLQEVCLATQQ